MNIVILFILCSINLNSVIYEDIGLMILIRKSIWFQLIIKFHYVNRGILPQKIKIGGVSNV